MWLSEDRPLLHSERFMDQPPTEQRLADKTDLIASSQSHDREAVQGRGTPEDACASAEALASSRSALQ